MNSNSFFKPSNDTLYQPVGAMPHDSVIRRAQKIKLLILDVDGVLTTG